MKNKLVVCLFIFSSLFFVQSLSAKRSSEHEDHAYVKPLPGNAIYYQEISGLDEYRLAMSGVEEKEIATQIPLEGKITKTVYEGKKDNSSFQIYKHIKKYFSENGFELIFEIKKEQCKNRFSNAIYELNPFRHDNNFSVSIPLKQGSPDSMYYLVWKGNKPSGLVYINCFIIAGWSKSPYYRIDVIEVASEASENAPARNSQSRSISSNVPENIPGNIPEFEIKLGASLMAEHQKTGIDPNAADDSSNKIEQPAADTALKAAPQKLVKVPSVTGKLRLPGKKTLENLGFKVKLVGKKVGKISKQSPAGGTDLKPGSVVTLTIGK